MRLVNPESVWNETVCVFADLVVRLSVSCRDVSKNGDNHPMPGEDATIDVTEPEEYLDMVGSRIPERCVVETEGFAFREVKSLAFLRDLRGFLILLTFSCVIFGFVSSSL